VERLEDSKVMYADAKGKHLVAYDGSSVFLKNLDHIILVMKNACRFKKKDKSVELEIKCPLYDECDRSKCLLTEELEEMKERIQR
jgi:hypothetical protein